MSAYPTLHPAVALNGTCRRTPIVVTGDRHADRPAAGRAEPEAKRLVEIDLTAKTQHRRPA